MTWMARSMANALRKLSEDFLHSSLLAGSQLGNSARRSDVLAILLHIL